MRAMNLRFPAFSCRFHCVVTPVAFVVSVASGAGLAARESPLGTFSVAGQPAESPRSVDLVGTHSVSR